MLQFTVQAAPFALWTETADDPQHNADQYAQGDTGDNRERDRPAASVPRHISRQMSERKMQPRQDDNSKPGNNKDYAEKNEQAAQIDHGAENLCSGQHRCGLAQKLRRLARFGEDADRTRQLAGLLANVLQVRVERREHNDAAGGKLVGDVVDQ